MPSAVKIMGMKSRIAYAHVIWQVQKIAANAVRVRKRGPKRTL